MFSTIAKRASRLLVRGAGRTAEQLGRHTPLLAKEAVHITRSRAVSGIAFGKPKALPLHELLYDRQAIGFVSVNGTKDRVNHLSSIARGLRKKPGTDRFITSFRDNPPIRNKMTRA